MSKSSNFQTHCVSCNKEFSDSYMPFSSPIHIKISGLFEAFDPKILKLKRT